MSMESSLKLESMPNLGRSAFLPAETTISRKVAATIKISVCYSTCRRFLSVSASLNLRKFKSGCHLPTLQETIEVWRSADAVCFDVDSTVITDEGLDQLAQFCGKAEEVKKLTVQAMQGGIEFRDALRARLNLIRPKLDTVQRFTKANVPKLTKDIERLVAALQARDTDVYLVSGGFRSLIAPVAKMLNIPLENIFANRLKFFYDGEYGGFDEAQLTSRSGGKAEVITYLKKRESYSSVVMIGDGATDMEACPPADAFIGFGGNIVRESVKNEATWYVYDFGTLIDELEREV